ncbi:hypothetical protein CHCC14598_1404 [Bacillus licheniformis]|nr:hypothetical protein CHCC14813_3837 [Bacillus licheniformis]TWM93709.1 hypothetical protein CHCC14598_1404 [Bacillus licheniformis]
MIRPDGVLDQKAKLLFRPEILFRELATERNNFRVESDGFFLPGDYGFSTS